MDSIKTTYSFNANQLPEDVLSYTDDKFYGFVREMLGDSAADLLNIQAINNVPSFLLTDNICDIIEFGAESEEIDALRGKFSFASRDGTFHVKLGIKNSFKFLNKLLSSKLEEENKKKRSLQTTKKISLSSPSLTKTNSISSRLSTTIDSTSPQLTTETDSTPPGLTTVTNLISSRVSTTIDSTSPQLTTETDSTPPGLTTVTNSISSRLSTTTDLTPPQLTTKTNSTPPRPIKTINSRSPPLTTKDDHVKFILNLMKKWTENNKEDLSFDQIELKPDVDYTISISDDNNIIEGTVKCKCGVRIKLRKRSDKFQITNFYKHLRTSSCSMMREKTRQHNEQNQLPNDTIDNHNNNNTNDNQSTASSSITSQQPLSDITIKTPSSQLHRTDTIPLSRTRSTKRDSSSLKATSSQELSAKRHKQ
jgi:hypothetical protein